MKPRFVTVGEGHVQKEVVAFAKARGWLCRKMKYEGRRGAPDYFFFGSGGRLLMIEFKRPKADAREQQRREHERLRSLGFEVRLVDDIDAGKRLFMRRGEHLL